MTAPLAACLLLAAVAVAVHIATAIDNAITNAAIRKDCADKGCGCFDLLDSLDELEGGAS